MGNAKKYVFKLYVVESTTRSKELVRHLVKIFDKAFQMNYLLYVVDVVDSPELAVQSKILATPTLVLESPKPSRRLVGNIKNEKDVLIGLNLLD